MNPESDLYLQAASERALRKWSHHDFYTSAVVLGLDIGMEGIGVWLRKGPECIFRRTFLFTLPESSPLKTRRQLRASRNARRSRRKRENLLKAWVAKAGLMSSGDVHKLWQNNRAFDRVFEHRLRAITEGKKLASAQALVVCIRHLIRHRGYDFHLLFKDDGAAFPWGDDLKLATVRKWAERGVLPGNYAEALKQKLLWCDIKENELAEITKMIEEASARYSADPIRNMLVEHLQNKTHPNLRQAARGENFPRELVKAHLRTICENHRHFFAPGLFDSAMDELIGKQVNESEHYDPKAESIIDFHRRTPDEVRELWERKEGECDLAGHLVDAGHLPSRKYPRSEAGHPAVRRWRALQFLCERTVELNTRERRTAPVDLIRQLLTHVDQDSTAFAERSPRPAKPSLGKLLDAACGKLMPQKTSELNKQYIAQLGDLVSPRQLARLRAKAPICAESAEVLYKLATNDESTFEPADVVHNLEDYYLWRKGARTGAGSYPQIEFLMGNPNHYDRTGQSKDAARRSDGRVQQHGILRRLFANQLRLDSGETVDISQHLAGRQMPDYVVVEVVGSAARNLKEKKEIIADQKNNRESRREIPGKYGLDAANLNDAQLRKVILFDQQANAEGEAICPYTGASLGRNPLAEHLEVEHVFPASRGGISIMENLVLTTRNTNQDKGERTPVEWLGESVAARNMARMHWNKRKRELFLRAEETCPSWENLTRVAQLARQLQAEVIRWLRIDESFRHIPDVAARRKAIDNEVRRRVGTPSGAITGACRESWRERLPTSYFTALERPGGVRLVKNRGNLRHHMWDAGVVSFVPPGDGMNSVQFGGVFLAVERTGGAPAMRALPGLAPDIAAVESSDPVGCYVAKLRKKNPKTARTKSQPQSLPDADGNIFQRVEIAKTVNKDGVVAAIEPDPLLKAVRLAGISSEDLSDHAVEQWEKDPRPMEEHPLRMKNGTPVRSLRLPVKSKPHILLRRPHVSPLGPAGQAPNYRSRMGHTRGHIIGIKPANDLYDRYELWAGPKLDKKGEPARDKQGQPVMDYHRVLVPTPAALASYRQLHGEGYRPEQPPAGFKKLGEIRKGDLLLAHLARAVPLDLAESKEKAFCSLWLRVASLNTSGKVEMHTAEFGGFSATLFAQLDKQPAGWEPSSPAVLARLLSDTAAARS